MTGGHGFIAVQCAQCSMMQVKQQQKQTRRGGGFTVSKWTCAVCNLRQSVVKVFARGPMARDLRGFVQEFNLARGSATDVTAAACLYDEEGWEELGGHEENRPSCYGSGDADEGIRCHQKRTDWSEYLDGVPSPADMDGGDGAPEEEEFAVVTELVFPEARPRLLGNGNEGNRSQKRYRRSDPDHSPPSCYADRTCIRMAEKSGRHDPDPSVTGGGCKWTQYFALPSCQPTQAKGPRLGGFNEGSHRSSWNVSSSRLSASAPSIGGGADRCVTAAKVSVGTASASSKWSAYLQDEEDDRDLAGFDGDLPFQSQGGGGDGRSRDGPDSYSYRPGSSGDVAVDEEIHPDFL